MPRLTSLFSKQKQLIFLLVLGVSYSIISAQDKQIIMNPDPAYIGVIPTLSSEITVFTLLNIKSNNVIINSMSFTGENAADYKILTNPIPSSIPGFYDVQVEVEYKPTNPGESSASFSINTSIGSLEIPIKAFATEVKDGKARFERILGIESNIDKSKAMQISQTVNGNFMIVASTQLRERIFRDVYLIKTDQFGKLLWYRVFEYGTMGGEPYDVGAEAGVDVITLEDESSIVLGHTNTGGPGSISVFVSKWDANGTMLWEYTYGGLYDDMPYNIIQDSEGNFLVAGSTNNSLDGSKNIMVLKIAPDGTLLWNKNYGSTGIENGFDIVEAHEGGYIIVGNYQNPTANISFLKIDKDGNQNWTKTLSNAKTTEGNVIRPTTDGGYIVSGYTLTDDFGMQGYLVKLNASVELVWEKTYGDNNIDFFKSVLETPDGGFIGVGVNNRFWSVEFVYDDVWLVKTDSDGNQIWEQKYGGDKSQYAADIIPKRNGGYAVTGETGSYRDKDRVYLLGIDTDGTITSIDNIMSEINSGSLSLLQNYPNPFQNTTTIEFNIPSVSDKKVSLKIYDILGKEIATLVDGNLNPGTYRHEFNTYKFQENSVLEGIYFYRLVHGSNSVTRKMILIRK